jgi:hypothetical protein
VTEHYPEIADAASDCDRIWFERHPGRHTYIRGFMPGELPLTMMSGDGVQCVAVRQMKPGARMRLPVYLPRMPGDSEYNAARIFRDALCGRA